MENISSAIWDATRGTRVMFYLVSPSEAMYEHVKDVPNYTEKVESCPLIMRPLFCFLYRLYRIL